MEFKTYTQEECDRFNGATGILGRVIAIGSELSYYHAKTDEEKTAITEWVEPYAVLRNQICMRDTEKIDFVYEQVKPLVIGEKPILTLEYMLTHPHNGKIG
jgi:hypothetical protein